MYVSRPYFFLVKHLSCWSHGLGLGLGVGIVLVLGQTGTFLGSSSFLRLNRLHFAISSVFKSHKTVNSPRVVVWVVGKGASHTRRLLPAPCPIPQEAALDAETVDEETGEVFIPQPQLL